MVKQRKGKVFSANRILALLLASLVVVVCIRESYVTAHAAENEGYLIWVGGTEITSDNCNSISGEGLSGNISYDPGSNTLTLDNATISSGYVYYRKDDKYMGTYKAAGIYVEKKDLKVVLSGENKVAPTVSLSGNYYYNDLAGIYAGNISFSGAGTLSVIAENDGIEAKNLIIEDGTDIDVYASCNSGPTTAVSADSLTVNGRLTAKSKSVGNPSTAVYAKTINVGTSGNLTAKATSPNTGYDAESIGVSGEMIINGTVTAGTPDYEYGIYGYGKGSVVVNADGVLTAIGSKQAIAEVTLSLGSDKLSIVAGEDESTAKEITLSMLESQEYVRIEKGTEQAEIEDPQTEGDDDKPGTDEGDSGTGSGGNSGTGSGTGSGENTGGGNDNGGGAKPAYNPEDIRYEADGKKTHLKWVQENGYQYWYEDGIRQAVEGDPKNIIDEKYGHERGREIFDPESGMWYWLDAVAPYCGAKAVGKEVWVPYVYQGEEKWDEATKRKESYASDKGLADLVYQAMINKTGKWVRYNENGGMLKGWVTIEGALADCYPKQAGNTYYYDTKTGMMVKGHVVIDGKAHFFDEETGVMQW